MQLISDNDYRNTVGCPVLTNVDEKKDKLERKIQYEHKRAKIMYNFVRDRRYDYFDIFAKIYNKKCAYCGISVGIENIRLFEVDHFVCESSFSSDLAGKSEAGKVSNLVFSCYSCNRWKKNLYLNDELQKKLNPDDNSISQIFVRDDDFYITIRKEYIKETDINDFYQKLFLGSEFRRLDYLLLEMENLIRIQKAVNSTIAEKLCLCFHDLIIKRNSIIF